MTIALAATPASQDPPRSTASRSQALDLSRDRPPAAVASGQSTVDEGFGLRFAEVRVSIERPRPEVAAEPAVRVPAVPAERPPIVAVVRYRGAIVANFDAAGGIGIVKDLGPAFDPIKAIIGNMQDPTLPPGRNTLTILGALVLRFPDDIVIEYANTAEGRALKQTLAALADVLKRARNPTSGADLLAVHQWLDLLFAYADDLIDRVGKRDPNDLEPNPRSAFVRGGGTVYVIDSGGATKGVNSFTDGSILSLDEAAARGVLPSQNAGKRVDVFI
jgi:hypothetical protein